MEVVIAVGLTGVSLVVLLGLLAALSRDAGNAADRRTAQTLPGAVTVELDALARQAGIDALAASLAPQSADTDAGLLLVAARDGTQLRRLDLAESPPRDAFFLIEVRRAAEGPLRFSADAGALAAAIRVSWPYRGLAAGRVEGVVPFGAREWTEFNVAVSR